MTGVLFITAAVGIVFAVWLVRLNISPFLVIILTILALLPIQDAAEIIICKGISIFFKPHHLPKMEFTEGIPDEFRTLIVYATLLSNKAAAARTLKHMVNAHLNNKDKNLPVAILTHFKDSSQEEVTEEESELLNFVSLAINSA